MKLITAIQLAVTFGTLTTVYGQQAVWGQCGGLNWTGPTTCVSGTTCVKVNDWYFQCQPGGTTPPPASSTTTTTTVDNPPSSTATTTQSQGTPGPTGACSTPSTVSGYSNAALPNPFKFNDGSNVQTKADWTCRRAQIAALIQGYEAGTLPGRPSQLSATFSQSGTTGTLSITAGDSGKSINWSNSIKYPSGTAPANGWPLVIGFDGGSLPIPSNFAVLSYSNSNMGAQNGSGSRGTGLFYNLYGSGHSASSMTAWVWGVSRIIDALESTPTAKINPAAIAVTGCSRNGKGALMVGAFETRIALTLPQESGSGGDACWRLSKYEKDSGKDVQTAPQIVTENPWFSSSFNNYVNSLNTLPYDHHLLAALVAPRALFSIANTDYTWLSPLSSYGCMSGARTVFQALGVPQNHGFIQGGGHSHCSFPSAAQTALTAFFNKFLQNQSVSTDFFTTNNQFGGVSYSASRWIDWTTPTLT